MSHADVWGATSPVGSSQCRALRQRGSGGPGAAGRLEAGASLQQQPTPLVLLCWFLGRTLGPPFQEHEVVSVSDGVSLGPMCWLGFRYSSGPLRASGTQSRPLHKPGVVGAGPGGGGGGGWMSLLMVPIAYCRKGASSKVFFQARFPEVS